MLRIFVCLLAPLAAHAATHDGQSGGAPSSSRPESAAPFVAQVLNGNPSAFPAVVRLSDGEGECSGTFVSTKVLVTAAHCLNARTGTLSVRGASGPLGNARCEKSPKAGNGLRKFGERRRFAAQCGGAGRCVPPGPGVPFDPGFPGIPENPGIPGIPGGPGPIPGGPDEGVPVEDVRNDLALCVLDGSVDEAQTACLDTSNGTPSSALLVGFGLSNQGSRILDAGRQRSGNLILRQGPEGILEGFNTNLQSGPDASSAPGDSGGFVGSRDGDGRLLLRAVVSGGDTVVDRKLARGGGAVPALNPANQGVSAFVDLRSENSLAFLKDFAARRGVSICGLDRSTPSPAGPRSPAGSPDVIPVGPRDLLAGGGSPIGFPGGIPGSLPGGFPGGDGFGRIGFPGGGFGGFPGDFRNPFFPGGGRLVRLRDGRLAFVPIGSRFGRGIGPRFGRRGRFGGIRRIGGIGGIGIGGIFGGGFGGGFDGRFGGGFGGGRGFDVVPGSLGRF